jgi:transcriptional regulator with XRE-family HTH domain
MVPPLDKKASAALAIGSKIRALRQRLKRTLDETAKAAGISKPFLSQVERGQATPSITSLVGIAQALGVTVQYFVETPTEAKSVCRGEDLKFFGFADSANLFGRLTNLSVDRKLEAILVKMPAGQQPSEVTTHAGEEFLYVMVTPHITSQPFRMHGLTPQAKRRCWSGSGHQDCFRCSALCLRWVGRNLSISSPTG